MNGKVFSGIGRIPQGDAPEGLTEGCLVLEGGAFRGVYTNGVTDALMEAGINFSCTVGVSAGAMTGMNYVSGQIGRSARINLRYRHDGRYVGVRAVRKNRGIIGFDFVFGPMEKVEPFDEKRFFDPARRFIAVAADCRTGEPVYWEKGSCDIYQAVRASASMPYISRIVEVEGVPCLDGGCSVKIPYAWALEQQFAKIVVVKTRPADFRRKAGQESLPFRFYRRYPKLAQALAGSAERYNAQCDEIEELSAQGRIFVIQPSRPITVSRLEKDMEKLGELYDLGYQDTRSALAGLREYLR